MSEKVLLTKELLKKIKDFFNKDRVFIYAEFEINDKKIMIEKVLNRGKIQYWVSVDKKYLPYESEEAKLYNFKVIKKTYKASKTEILKRYIKLSGKKKGTIEAEEFIKDHTYEYYIPYSESYRRVEEMLKRHENVYLIGIGG